VIVRASLRKPRGNESVFKGAAVCSRPRKTHPLDKKQWFLVTAVVVSAAASEAASRLKGQSRKKMDDKKGQREERRRTSIMASKSQASRCSEGSSGNKRLTPSEKYPSMWNESISAQMPLMVEAVKGSDVVAIAGDRLRKCCPSA
jgi:hypothetical protein